MEATGCPETSVTTNLRCVTCQKSEISFTRRRKPDITHTSLSAFKQLGNLHANSEIRTACWCCFKVPGNLQHVDWEIVTIIPEDKSIYIVGVKQSEKFSLVLKIEALGSPQSVGKYFLQDITFHNYVNLHNNRTYIRMSCLRIKTEDDKVGNVRITLHWGATIVEVKTQYYIFWICVYSLRYKAWNAHAPYSILICGLSRSTIFFYIIS